MADAAAITRRMREDYERGLLYKRNLNLFETVDRNERFYTGDQWHGLKVRSIRPITMNVIRRAVTFFQATIVSDDVTCEIRPPMADETQELFCHAYEQEIDRVIERAELKKLGREALRDGAVDGDGIVYFFFDPEEESGQAISGEIRAECLMNTNVILGNPYSTDIQRQPWFMIVRRRSLAEVRQEAKALGIDPDLIRPESNSEFVGEEHAEENSLCTELVRFWRDEEKKMHILRAVGETVLEEKVTDQALYPIAWFSWEPRKNCCHGISPITEAIPNQIAINQMWTAVNTFVHGLAFPKMIYNKAKFPNGWNGDPGKAIATNGDPKDSIVNTIGGAQLPGSIINIMDRLVDRTMELLGVSDAALGNIRPDNTSAIVAVQDATAAPLYLQRLRYFTFWEHSIRILIDLMRCHYGQRQVVVHESTPDPLTGVPNETDKLVKIDFGAMARHTRDLTVEIGETSYWSRLIQVSTADNLLRTGFYQDQIDYLEAIPDGLIRNKAELVRKLRDKQKMGAVIPAQQPTAGANINLAGAVGR